MAKQLWTESLYEYCRAMKNAPQLLYRIAFRPRTIEEELVEASLKGSLAKVLSGYELLSIVRFTLFLICHENTSWVPTDVFWSKLQGLGSVIGSGIFLLTGQAALITGSVSALTKTSPVTLAPVWLFLLESMSA